MTYFFIIIPPPPELLPVLGQLERYMTPTLDAALLSTGVGDVHDLFFNDSFTRKTTPLLNLDYNCQYFFLNKTTPPDSKAYLRKYNQSRLLQK